MLDCRSSVRKAALGVFSAFTLALALAPAAVAQENQDLVAALKKKYRITEINSEGVAANPGTVLTIEADGINAEPYPTMITFENPVIDGQVKQRSKGLGFLKSTNLQILQPGQKVYITKINSSSQSQDDSLKITILTTDALVATYSGNYGGHYQTAKRYSTTLAFKLPKGSLSQLSVDDAAKTIEAVLSFNAADQGHARINGAITRACEPHCAVSATTGEVQGATGGAQQPDQQQQQQPQQQQQAPATVAIGQTPEQVIAAIGQPAQVIDLGAKRIYKYPDMKVIFLNGKVSDVQ